MLIGDAEMRGQTREALRALRDIEILGELTAFEGRHARFVNELAPNVVVLDLTAKGLNPFRVVTSLDNMTAQPRVIGVAPDGFATRQLARQLGADAVVTTGEGLRQAIRRVVPRIVPNHDFDRAA